MRGAPLLIALILGELLLGAHSEGFDRLRDAHLIRGIGVPELFPPVVRLGAVGIATGLLVSLGNFLTEKSIRRLDRPGVPLATLTIVAAIAIGRLLGLFGVRAGSSADLRGRNYARNRRSDPHDLVEPQYPG